jgi:hypothetical protein
VAQTRVSPPLPAGLKAELRPYQVEGFHFLAYLSANHFGGVLADDMGLGKTLQTLTWLAWLRAEEGNAGKVALVVGYSLSTAGATNVSWYSAANLIAAKVYPTGTQAEEPLHSCPESLIMTKPGENLGMQQNTTLVPTFVLYVAELDSGLYLA